MRSEISPFLKWIGGKKKSLNIIHDKLSKEHFNSYFEPFVGGGAVFINLAPKNAVISDNNSELINAYKVVKNKHEELISLLDSYFISSHSEAFYYSVRSWDREENYTKKYTEVQRAARFVYLNKTCFNGIYRVNRNNQFNVPFGKYDSAKHIYNKTNIIKLNKLFNDNDVSFKHRDYLKIISEVKKGDLVYLDPPYDVELNSNGFTAYTNNGFNRDNQKELKSLCDTLIKRGAKVYISNSNTAFIRNLYLSDSNYTEEAVIQIHRTVGGAQKARRVFEEILISGRKGW